MEVLYSMLALVQPPSLWQLLVLIVVVSSLKLCLLCGMYVSVIPMAFADLTHRYVVVTSRPRLPRPFSFQPLLARGVLSHFPTRHNILSLAHAGMRLQMNSSLIVAISIIWIFPAAICSYVCSDLGSTRCAFLAGKEAGLGRRLGFSLGGVTCHFRREIKPYEAFKVFARVLCSDEKWLKRVLLNSIRLFSHLGT